jgi:hypothetical protein
MMYGQTNIKEKLLAYDERPYCMECWFYRSREKIKSCLEIRMQDEITILGLIIVPSKGLKSSDIWEQL